MKKLLIITFAILTYLQCQSQGPDCLNAAPFCTGTTYLFPAQTNVPNLGTYQCLMTTPNAAWYYMQIADSGNINIFMQSNPLVDIDFACWGPFASVPAGCATNLQNQPAVSCSYSTAATETCVIPNGQTGEIYILLITNYSNMPCNIGFSQTSGTGATNCGILTPPISNNGPLCVGATLNLTAQSGPTGCTYLWTGPNAFTSSQQSPAIPNVTMAMAGDYFLQIISGVDTSNAVSTTVDIFPVPTSTFTISSDSVCVNQTTSVNYTGTASSATFIWDVDGGTPNSLTGPGPHDISWGTSGLITISLVVNENSCSSSSTNMSVFVKPTPVADAGSLQIISGGSATTLNGSATGGSGNYSYSWSPAVLLQNENVQNPLTVPLNNTTIFTLSVTDNETGCIGTANVQIMVTGGPLSVAANVVPSSVCSGHQTMLQAIPTGGTGIYNYSWTSNPAGFTSTVQNPLIYPTVTTQYIVQIFSGIETASASVTAQVISPPDTPGLIAGSTSVCKGTSNISYTVPSVLNATSYTWILPNGSTIVSGQGTNSIIVNYATNAISGGISVMGNNACGTGQASSIAVTVHSNPVVNAGVNQTISSGSTVTFNGSVSGGSGDYSYFWSPTNLFQNAGLQNPTTIAMTTSAIITLTVVDNITGCSGNASVQVIVAGGPLSVSASVNPATICQGDQTSLQSLPTGGSGSYTYLWTSNPAWFTSSLQNTIDFPAISTQYTVSISDGSQSASASVNVTVNALPANAGNITGPSSVNQGASGITYSVPVINNATNYIWSFPQGVNIVSGNNTNSIVVDFSTGSTSGIITVYGNNSCGYGVISPVFPITVLTDIDEVPEFYFNLYPNPTNGIVTVEMSSIPNERLTLKVYNIVGELLFEAALNNEKRQSFHLNNFANGLYYVNIMGNKFHKIEKLIIQK